MILTINLKPETESALRERAAATGRAVEEMVREHLEESFGNKNGVGGEALSIEERLRRWEEFVQRGLAQTKHLPPGHVVDDSRESIYEDRW